MVAKVRLESDADFDDAQRAIKKLNNSIDDMSASGKKAGLSLTDLKSGLDMAANALQEIGKAYEATIGRTIEYAEQVRDLGRISGASATDTSRLIQTADDLKVSYETLQQAAKALAKDGIALTTEELAKASDEYLAITDAGARAEFATSKFGRAGLELTKVLETGGDALRKMAKEQASSLILTQKQIDQAREIEKAQDDWEDSVAGLTYQFSTGLLPVIGDIIKATTQYVFWAQKTKDAVMDEASTYPQYIQRLNEEITARNQNNVLRSVGMGLMPGLVRWLDVEAQKNMLVTETQFNLAKGYYNIADEGTRAAAAHKQYTQDADAARQANYLGAVAMDEFASSVGASSLAVQDINTNMRALINDAMRPLTAEMLYQKAAAGLDEDAALDLAKSMGLINTEAYNALVALRDLRTQYDINKDGAISAAEAANGYAAAVKALAAGDYLVKIRADFSELERALAMAERLNKAGTAGISGPTFSWTPPSGGTTTPTPTPGYTPPSTEETGGKLANGGPASPDKSYLVGEEGPEIFRPDRPGTVIPNNKIGGGNTYNIYGWQGDARSLADEIDRQERIRRLTQ
jgi:hypothetical protein